MLTRLAFPVTLIAVVVGVLFWTFGKVVPPNQIGVRQNFFSFLVFEKGFASRGLEPGLHWTVPFVSEIRLLPRGFQYIHFNDSQQLEGIDLPSLDVPTRDGSKVKTDVTLITRLYAQRAESGATSEPREATSSSTDEDEVPLVARREIAHGGPRDLVESLRLEPREQLERFARVAEDEMRRSLGKLSSTDYYNPVIRERAAIVAHDAINDAMAPKGIELWAALIRRYRYIERTIDDQIFQKNLQEQTESLNAALSRLAAAQAETEKERALWDAKIRDLEVQGEATVRVLRSEGDLVETTKRSEGDRAVAEATAEVDELRARALSEVAGAKVYTAREMAPLLKTLGGGVVSGLDPYDVNAWMQRLIGSNGNGGGR